MIPTIAVTRNLKNTNCKHYNFLIVLQYFITPLSATDKNNYTESKQGYRKSEKHPQQRKLCRHL